MSKGASIALMREPSASIARTGWRSDEETLLWSEVKTARSEGRPLKSVFDSVASKTGRKPNSIRNFYYAKVREDPEHEHSPAFVPFTQDEIWDLLVTVLAAQARGQSVRACTLDMGRGDTRAMLRYQNKYRALVKNNPVLVSEVVRYMRENDMPSVDPYEKGMAKRRARKQREDGDGMKSLAVIMRLSGELEDALRRIAELENAVDLLRRASAV